jgi:hypothetical protein
MWHDALCAKYDGVGEFGRKEWDQLLGDCQVRSAVGKRRGKQTLIIVQAVCDWPACAFAKELIEAYPNAKVILSTRDVDTWHAYVLIRAFTQKKRLCLTPSAVLS